MDLSLFSQGLVGVGKIFLFCHGYLVSSVNPVGHAIVRVSLGLFARRLLPFIPGGEVTVRDGTKVFHVRGREITGALRVSTMRARFIRDARLARGKIYIGVVAVRRWYVNVRRGAITAQVVRDRNAPNNRNVLLRLIVVAVVTNGRILVRHVVRLRVVRHFTVTNFAIVRGTISNRSLTVVNRC